MGLDMFLYKVEKEEKEEIAYWRKANAIHAWFERNCADGELENCQEYVVTKENLEKLKQDCETVLNSSRLVYKTVPVREYNYDKRDYVTVERTMNLLEDSSVAEELLPTQSGFFFGSTFYDEWYVEDLKETVEKIKDILKDKDLDKFTMVYSAWW